MFLIPTSLRVALIAQICAGLCCLLWIVSYPFAGVYFTHKSDLLLIESVMGKQASLKALSAQKSAEFEPMAKAFSRLFEQQDQLTQKWVKDQEFKKITLLQKSLSEKLYNSLKYFREIPLFEFIWACAAVLVSVCLLLKNPWSLIGVWLLPVAAAAYVISNIQNGINPLQISERHLFPTESDLLAEPLKGSLAEQRERLEKAWKSYLIAHWAKQIPSSNREQFERQAISGEFYFNLERIRHLPASPMQTFWERKSFSLLGIYLLWNLSIAIYVYSLCRRKKSAIPAK
jgi:hypothetical protein